MLMRKIKLENIYAEMLDISSAETATPRFKKVLDEIQSDLNRADLTRPEPVAALNIWWERYRGLSTYIYR